jgi:broad specificity phosphatase PhoE
MTIVLIRHGERHPSGSDALSPAGKKRATLLAQMFKGSGVTAIFTSEFTRTKETAKPLAQAVGITSRIIAADATAARTQVLAAGACPIVVGHSDTVPALIAALGGPDDIEINELEFDRMFVVTVGSGAVSTLDFRYVNT